MRKRGDMSKIFRIFAIITFIALLSLIIMGCGSEHLQASPDKVSLGVNTTQQLNITLVPMAAKATNVTDRCTYTTSDESIATVSNGGLITGLKQGSVTINVSYSYRSSSVNVIRKTTIPVQVK